jgi:hypothetical protein
VRRAHALAFHLVHAGVDRGERARGDGFVQEVQFVEVQDASVGSREQPRVVDWRAETRGRLDVDGSHHRVLRRG